MPIENLDRKSIDELLLKVGNGALGTGDSEGNPYVVPMGFNYVEGAIYMFYDFDRGEKLENMRRNPNVCFEVTYVEPPNSVLRSERSRKLSSVIVRGKAEEVVDETEKIKVWGEASLKRMREVRPKGVYYKIKLEKITGKSFTMGTA